MRSWRWCPADPRRAAGPGQQIWRPWIRHQRALVAMATGRLDLARETAIYALEGFTTLRHRYGSAQCRLVIGRCYLRDGQYAKATPVLEEAHSTLVRCG